MFPLLSSDGSLVRSSCVFSKELLPLKRYYQIFSLLLWFLYNIWKHCTFCVFCLNTFFSQSNKGKLHSFIIPSFRTWHRWHHNDWAICGWTYSLHTQHIYATVLVGTKYSLLTDTHKPWHKGSFSKSQTLPLHMFFFRQNMDRELIHCLSLP